MRVVVFIPARNSPGLWDTVESVAQQDFWGLKLLIGDDGSDPPVSEALAMSGEKCLERLGKLYPNLPGEVHANPATTKGDIWRFFPALTAGFEYVCVLWPGDTLKPTAIGDMVYELDGNPDANLVVGKGELVVRRQKSPPKPPDGLPLSGMMFRSSLLDGGIGGLVRELTGATLATLDTVTLVRKVREQDLGSGQLVDTPRGAFFTAQTM